MTYAGAEELLAQIVEQIEGRPLEGKFVGDVILLTPHCAPSFLEGFSSYISTGSLMKGQSIYQDKLGAQVAAKNFTLRAMPTSPEFSRPQFVTSDGFGSP